MEDFGSGQLRRQSASLIFRSRLPPPVWRHRQFQRSPLDKVLWISRPAVPWGVFYRTTPGLAQKVKILITWIRYHLSKEIGWDLYTLKNASGLSRRLLWGLCWPNESAGRAHRSCCIENGFWNTFFVKSMHFWVTNFSLRLDLEGSERWDKNSVQFNLLYGHPNT